MCSSGISNNACAGNDLIAARNGASADMCIFGDRRKADLRLAIDPANCPRR